MTRITFFSLKDRAGKTVFYERVLPLLRVLLRVGGAPAIRRLRIVDSIAGARGQRLPVQNNSRKTC